MTLPTAPSTLRPDTFAAEMDAFLAALPPFEASMNAVGGAFALSVTATSVTSLTIGTGTKSLTVDVSKGYVPGMAVLIANTASPGNSMLGTVTSYNSGTGALVVEVTVISGSGTASTWTTSLATTVSFDGQTFTNLLLAGKITETVYALSGTVIAPGNGSIQTKTLASNTTFTESLAAGDSVVLQITAGAYTVVWPTTSWLWGSAPTLSATGVTIIVLWKTGSTLFGVLAGAS